MIIAIVLLVLGLAAAAGFIIGALHRSRQKRRRLAAVYDEIVEDTEPVEVPPPLPPRAAPVSVRTIPPAPVPTRARERMRSAYSPPSAPAEPGPVLFGDPVRLEVSGPTELTGTNPEPGGVWIHSSEPLRLVPVDPAPAAPPDPTAFGGEFGGAGASGGWDEPPSGGNAA